MLSKKCKACGKTSNDGIDIFGIHICRLCEKNIVEVKMGDFKYEYYKSVLRKLWIDYIFQTN